MGYPNPLKIVARQVSENVVIAHSPFKRVDKINFGARMAAFNYNNSIVVWSALPYNSDVASALQLLAGEHPVAVKYLIIPDKEHTMAAVSFKEKFPELKIIAMEDVDLGTKAPVDFRITSAVKHKILAKPELQDLGISDGAILDNFEFVFLPFHTNKELVMLDKNDKTLYEADLLFNLRSDAKLEQFAPEFHEGKDYNPHTGWSYITRYMNPDSSVGKFLFNKIANTSKSAEGLRAIYLWDFDRIVMCHGNIIEKNGREEFKKVFGSVLT